MSAAILPAVPATDSLRRKRFTRREVERMLDLGIFDGQRCELIDGELIDKMGQNPPHAQSIRNLFSWLIRIFGPGRLQMQLPVELSGADSEWSLPEPDIAVLANAGGEFGQRHPRGEELVLVVEVADTGLRQDLATKRDLYARASVDEYWVLDLQGRRVVVHRRPERGEYREIVALAESDLVFYAGHPEHGIAVRELLP